MKPDNTQETIYVGLDTGLPPYLPYPRFLLKMDISQTAKLLYALLLDRTTLSQRNGWQDDQGRTFIVYPIAEIAEMLDKGQTAIKAALNELDAAGLLERKRAGFSAANRLYVKLPPLVRISDPMTVGKATLISAENRPTDGRKSDLMTVGKPTPNNLTINNLIENQTMGVSGEPHKPFGRYENVFLTGAEYAELKTEFPDRLERLIEEMSRCLAGNGPTKIARMLTEQQIPTPGTLEYQRTGSTRRYHPGYECKWATNTVVHILENREYTGCLVNFKTEKPSYKVKHSVENPIEKQAIFENHHEPLIDMETWERVQELRKQRKRPNRYDEVGLFSGILFCADCGHVLYQQRYQNKDRKQDCYICGSYKKRTRDCTAHFIRTDLLTAGVLANLRQVTEYAAKHESRFVKLLVQQNEIGGKRKTAAATKQLEQAQERIAEVSRIIKRLYEDNVNGKISDERFMELSADYEAEQAELKKRAAALQAELDKSQAATVNAEKFMGIVRKHLAFEELTPTLLREMVEKIVVHECSYDENGTRRQDIEIYYSFVGKIDLPE